MRRPILVIFIILLFISFIYTYSKPLDDIEGIEKIRIEGIVKNKIEKENYNQYEIGKYLVNDYSKKIDIKIGEIVKINGNIKSLDDKKFENFNYGRYIKSMGYKGIINIENYKIKGKNKFYYFVGEIKRYIRTTFRYLYKEKSNFINSIILGTKQDLSEEEKDMFSKTGTSHVIAISGLHTAILSSLVIFVVRGINRFYKLIILSVFMFIYSTMVGKTPSITRSIIFIFIMYISVFIEEKRDGICTLSLIGSFLVIGNPYIIYNISFQLSFMATLSIIYFYKIINDYLRISIVSISISANILTFPIIYYVFGGIPILFVLGNLIIVPSIDVIIILSLVSIVLFKFSVFASKILAYLSKNIIIMVYYLLEKLAGNRLAYIEIKNPKLFYVTFYYISIFSYMIYRELKIMKEQENEI